MSVPRATMRLQFHRGFPFAAARPLVPYFAALGISHVYASPILTARPGSAHGYDVIDPTRINPELGGEDEFRRLVEQLRQHGLGLIVDIVPNHMAIGAGNPWWMDVLADGTGSRYAKYFDIDWHPPNPHLHNKVLLPVLGRPYGEALAAGELKLARDGDPGKFAIHYFDHVFPVLSESAADVSLDAFDAGSAQGRERLHHLLERQHYRLSWWRAANDEINWRRFFDINELAAIRVEDDEVFDAVHESIFRFYAEGLIDGVRVDHIDGLSQPEAYCKKLRARLRELEHKRPAGCPAGPAYFVVEKILASDERLPLSWETDGTTGYDFMDEVSALLHAPAGEAPLTALWQRVSGRPADFGSEEELARRQILERSFSAQRDALVQTLHQIADGDLATRDYAAAAMRRCVNEILAHFAVYRIYARVGCASDADLAYLARAAARAKATCLPSDAWLVDTLCEWLSGRRLRPKLDSLQATALGRFQQLSAPLCAKAVEDTAFYRYGRLLSRTDVGFDACSFALAPSEFHRRMQARAADYPHAMLATATHDHKRGEDVRARLAVLSEIPDEWAAAVERWLELSEPYCRTAGGMTLPSAGDRAILFQMIVGAWPIGLSLTDRNGLAAYAKRLAAWQEKALREAKLHSDWSAPNDTYEGAAKDLIQALFSTASELLGEMAAFAARIAPAGAANGIAQAVLKLTAPGVPDFYQGTEFWDLSLVDPDNRSPVDFAARQNGLAAAAAALPEWWDRRIKQAVIQRVLTLRAAMRAVFSDGAYLPLQTRGPQADHVVAFARVSGETAAIVVVCRLAAVLLPEQAPLAIPASRWPDTQLIVPKDIRGAFVDVLTGDRIAVDGAVCIAQILSRLPVAVLAPAIGAQP